MMRKIHTHTHTHTPRAACQPINKRNRRTDSDNFELPDTFVQGRGRLRRFSQIRRHVCLGGGLVLGIRVCATAINRRRCILACFVWGKRRAVSCDIGTHVADLLQTTWDFDCPPPHQCYLRLVQAAIQVSTWKVFRIVLNCSALHVCMAITYS